MRGLVGRSVSVPVPAVLAGSGVTVIGLTAQSFGGPWQTVTAPSGMADACGSGAGGGNFSGLIFQKIVGSVGATSGFACPTDWTTFHVDLAWTSTNGDAGQIARMGGNVIPIRDNTAAGSANQAIPVTSCTARAQGTMNVTRLATSLSTANLTGNFCAVDLYRIGNDGVDNLTTSLTLMGLLLTKAT